MTDLRYDPIFERWVCIAENHMQRPIEFQHSIGRQPGLECPFCRGNESLTPAAIAELAVGGGRADSAEWTIRVIPNKYPAFECAAGNSPAPISEEPLSSGSGGSPGPGKQEVIILSPRHVTSLTELNAAELTTSFQVFQQRVRHYQQLPGIRHVSLFMNCRPDSGASIEHVHFQLIGMPICTPQVRQPFQRMVGDSGNGVSPWHRRLQFELDDQRRILEVNDRFVALCPYASRHAFQIQLIPTEGLGSFSELDIELCHELARLCQQWIARLEQCLDAPAYNLVFFLPPNEQATAPWFVEISPRLAHTAGFELLTDCWVNPTSPESAATRLRDR